MMRGQLHRLTQGRKKTRMNQATRFTPVKQMDPEMAAADVAEIPDSSVQEPRAEGMDDVGTEAAARDRKASGTAVAQAKAATTIRHLPT